VLVNNRQVDSDNSMMFYAAGAINKTFRQGIEIGGIGSGTVVNGNMFFDVKQPVVNHGKGVRQNANRIEYSQINVSPALSGQH
jgi:hypothetical protein